ncbi:Ribosome 60S biogenesis N-terminal-domain-containing protein [Balamuthia mandrillaris]
MEKNGASTKPSGGEEQEEKNASFESLKEFLAAINSELEDDNLTALRLFKAQVEGRSPAKNKKFDLLTEYLLSSPECVEIFRIWQTYHKAARGSQITIAAVEALTTILKRNTAAATKHVNLSISRQVLRTGMKAIYGTLESEYFHAIMASLRLLTALARNNATSARTLVNTFNFSLKTLPRVSIMRQKDRSLDRNAEKDVRTHFLRFCMAFMRSGEGSVTYEFLNKAQPVLSLIWKGLPDDPPQLVQELLECLAQNALPQPTLPKAILLSSLYTIQAFEQLGVALRVASERGNTQSQKVLKRFILLLCCDREKGICSQHPAWATSSSEKLLSFKHKEHDGSSTAVAPSVLRLVLALSGANTDPLQQDTVLRVLAASPELLPEYLEKVSYSWEARFSLVWLANARYLCRLLSLPPPPMPTRHRPNASQAAVLLQHWLPPPAIHRLLLSKGLQHSHKIVQFYTLHIIHSLFARLPSALWLSTSSTTSPSWASRMRQHLKQKLRKRMPDIQTLLPLLRPPSAAPLSSQSNKEDSMAIEEKEEEGENAEQESLLYLQALRVLHKYQQWLPETLVESRFSYAKLIPDDMEQQFAPALQLVTLKVLAHALRQLIWSPWAAAGSSKLVSTSRVAILLRLYVNTPREGIRKAAGEVLQGMLRATQLFEEDPSELATWLKHLSAETVPFLLSALEGCLGPHSHRYTDGLAAALHRHHDELLTALQQPSATHDVLHNSLFLEKGRLTPCCSALVVCALSMLSSLSAVAEAEELQQRQRRYVVAVLMDILRSHSLAHALFLARLVATAATVVAAEQDQKEEDEEEERESSHHHRGNDVAMKVVLPPFQAHIAACLDPSEGKAAMPLSLLPRNNALSSETIAKVQQRVVGYLRHHADDADVRFDRVIDELIADYPNVSLFELPLIHQLVATSSPSEREEEGAEEKLRTNNEWTFLRRLPFSVALMCSASRLGFLLLPRIKRLVRGSLERYLLLTRSADLEETREQLLLSACQQVMFHLSASARLVLSLEQGDGQRRLYQDALQHILFLFHLLQRIVTFSSSTASVTKQSDATTPLTPLGYLLQHPLFISLFLYQHGNETSTASKLSEGVTTSALLTYGIFDSVLEPALSHAKHDRKSFSTIEQLLRPYMERVASTIQLEIAAVQKNFASAGSGASSTPSQALTLARLFCGYYSSSSAGDGNNSIVNKTMLHRLLSLPLGVLQASGRGDSSPYHHYGRLLLDILEVASRDNDHSADDSGYIIQLELNDYRRLLELSAIPNRLQQSNDSNEEFSFFLHKYIYKLLSLQTRSATTTNNSAEAVPFSSPDYVVATDKAFLKSTLDLCFASLRQRLNKKISDQTDTNAAVNVLACLVTSSSRLAACFHGFFCEQAIGGSWLLPSSSSPSSPSSSSGKRKRSNNEKQEGTKGQPQQQQPAELLLHFLPVLLAYCQRACRQSNNDGYVSVEKEEEKKEKEELPELIRYLRSSDCLLELAKLLSAPSNRLRHQQTSPVADLMDSLIRMCPLQSETERESLARAAFPELTTASSEQLAITTQTKEEDKSSPSISWFRVACSLLRPRSLFVAACVDRCLLQSSCLRYNETDNSDLQRFVSLIPHFIPLLDKAAAEQVSEAMEEDEESERAEEILLQKVLSFINETLLVVAQDAHEDQHSRYASVERAVAEGIIAPLLEKVVKSSLWLERDSITRLHSSIISHSHFIRVMTAGSNKDLQERKTTRQGDSSGAQHPVSPSSRNMQLPQLRKDILVRLLQAIYQSCPACCDRQVLPVLLAGYGATLHPTDVTLRHILQLYEAQGIPFSSYGFAWGSLACSRLFSSPSSSGQLQAQLQAVASQQNQSTHAKRLSKQKSKKQRLQQSETKTDVAVANGVKATPEAVGGRIAARMLVEGSLLDRKRLRQSSHLFPYHQPLLASDNLLLKEKEGSPQRYSAFEIMDMADDTCKPPPHWRAYDPCFVLPLLEHLIKNSATTDMDCGKLIELGAVQYALIALSSLDVSMRSVAYSILAQFYEMLENNDFRERAQVKWMLSSLKHAITTPNQYIPTPISAFLARAVSVLAHPEHHLFRSINSFLLSRPFLDLEDIPMFYALFNSSEEEWRKEREWLLLTLRQGINHEQDLELWKRRHVFEILLSFYDSNLCDHHNGNLVLETLARAANNVPACAIHLIKSGALSWLGLAFTRTNISSTHLQWMAMLLSSLAKTIVHTNDHREQEVADQETIEMASDSFISSSEWQGLAATLPLLIHQCVLRLTSATEERGSSSSLEQTVTLMRVMLDVARRLLHHQPQLVLSLPVQDAMQLLSSLPSFHKRGDLVLLWRSDSAPEQEPLQQQQHSDAVMLLQVLFASQPCLDGLQEEINNQHSTSAAGALLHSLVVEALSTLLSKTNPPPDPFALQLRFGFAQWLQRIMEALSAVGALHAFVERMVEDAKSLNQLMALYVWGGVLCNSRTTLLINSVLLTIVENMKQAPQHSPAYVFYQETIRAYPLYADNLLQQQRTKDSEQDQQCMLLRLFLSRLSPAEYLDASS